MKVLLLFDDIDNRKNNSVFVPNNYSFNGDHLWMINIEGINKIHLSIEEKKLYVRGESQSEIYKGDLDESTYLIILSHWGDQNRKCSGIFYNNSKVMNYGACLDLDLEGYWKRIHNEPKILLCEGKYEGMGKLIRSFASKENETIRKLEENLENNEYESN